MEQSGYARLKRGPAVLLADAGPVGPDYLPGHAHADTLCFELSLQGQRICVNSGTSTYEPSDLRKFQQSTRAHNTVAVNGADSSEVWGAFRVARRARAVVEILQPGNDEDMLSAVHDGYCRLPGRPVHRRTWRLDSGGLRVEDEISGKGTYRGADGELLPDEERLTRFGRFLRAASLDELPELVNVVKGERYF
jgi:uncharacterized heparinase superfamily protein